MTGEAIACAARRLGADADAVLARIGGRLGVEARASAAILAKLSPSEERMQRARWLATARLPAPLGARAIHATWIEAALTELPARARTAVAGGGDATDIWLARRAFAGFVAMPAPSTIARIPDELPALAPDALRAWLERAGADQLARAAEIAGGDALALARTSLAEALDRIERAPRFGELGSNRAVLQRCAGIANDELRLARIGARVVAPHLDDVVRRQIIQRLPRALGLAIRADLDGFAAAPHLVSWFALA
jgi:hypothetical protein